MKILIIGSPGSGKTTFAKKLHAACSIPLYHLDDYYWLAGWQRPDKNQWYETVLELVQKLNWIIEGNHYSTLDLRLQYADIVIFFDIPTWKCFARILKRTVLRFKGEKTSLPINIRSDTNYKYKLSLNLHFINLVLFFKWKVKSKIFQKDTIYYKNFISIKNNCDMEKTLEIINSLIIQKVKTY